ncbi:hypothetical protein BKA58DRAFT_317599 [Alternaria rosae]|uniref:uncharacterized protein n=1 Tax=Alternaria rosae TaxID=1187941 RepID=UPI001E8E7918|nr:uncharacterized protein BKA58DRAFT_317599 [Alternaria rosae]KAH6868810.1 hypothetical protein BKA58DRAFT_317599 [Alternaria rosae]
MAINWILPVRAAQAVLSIVVLGLMAYVSSWWSTHWRQSSPMEINYLIFAPSWTILSLIPLLLTSLPKFSHLSEKGSVKWALLGLEGLTMLFWFSGFVALAVFLSGRICFGMVCDVARASTVISSVSWLAWAVTFVFGVIGVVKGRSGGMSMGFGSRAPKNKEVDMHQGV